MHEAGREEEDETRRGGGWGLASQLARNAGCKAAGRREKEEADGGSRALAVDAAQKRSESID